MKLDIARLGIMGGTFDPIHNGHLICAEEARWQFSLDRVLFVPAGRPWQKRETASAEDRYFMAFLATSPNENFSASRMELDRSEPTYTLATLRQLRDFYGPQIDLFFITGADAILQILTWKDAERVMQEAHLIAATRPGYDLSKLESLGFGSRVVPMTIPALAISSTEIRARLAEGRPIKYLVPESVIAYIDERQLYRRPVPAKSSSGDKN